MGFTQKWAHARIVAVQQCGVLGFLPWGHKGVCATMTQDWFRRIDKGRLTWLAAKNQARDSVNWKDKRDRWMNLQATGQFSQDQRFGYTSKPTDLLSNDTHMVVQSRTTSGGLFSKDDAATIWGGLQGIAFDTTNAFFVLSIFGSKGGTTSASTFPSFTPPSSRGSRSSTTTRPCSTPAWCISSTPTTANTC